MAKTLSDIRTSVRMTKQSIRTALKWSPCIPTYADFLPTLMTPLRPFEKYRRFRLQLTAERGAVRYYIGASREIVCTFQNNRIEGETANINYLVWSVTMLLIRSIVFKYKFSNLIKKEINETTMGDNFVLKFLLFCDIRKKYLMENASF